LEIFGFKKCPKLPLDNKKDEKSLLEQFWRKYNQKEKCLKYFFMG